MGPISSRIWLRIGIFNFLIVATIGFIMRYKIGYSFPMLDQKNLLHAHSHFAFAGWASHMIMFFISRVIAPHINSKQLKHYQIALIINAVASYGMLISFTLWGYVTISIIFSTTSLLTSLAFAILCYRDFTKATAIKQGQWFLFANAMQVLSSIGTAVLVYTMITHQILQQTYLASIYWYLHFQYNGWFFFACLGLLFTHIQKLVPDIEIPQSIFIYFSLSCIPAYGLSVLWLDLPLLVYLLVILAAICQLCGWIVLFRFLKQHSILNLLTSGKKVISIVYIFIFVALSIKIILQFFSVIPSISEMAFGFRPIVIAYLHLILLAVISLFLIATAYSLQIIVNNTITIIAILLLSLGVLLNECALGLQGIASLSYTPIPHIDQILVIISGLLVFSIGLLFLSQIHSYNKTKDL